MKATLALLTLAALASLHVCAAWQVGRHLDPITDDVSYTVSTPGERLNEDSWLADNHPVLVFRIIPHFVNRKTNTLKAEILAHVYFDPDGIPRNGCTALVRFDSNTAKMFYMEPSTDRRAAFFSPEDSRHVYTAARKSSVMLMRIETTLGHIRTFRFDLAGLPDALATARQRIFSHAHSVTNSVPND